MLLFVPHKVFSYFIGLVWASIGARAFGIRAVAILRRMGKINARAFDRTQDEEELQYLVKCVSHDQKIIAHTKKDCEN